MYYKFCVLIEPISRQNDSFSDHVYQSQAPPNTVMSGNAHSFLESQPMVLFTTV